MPSNICRYLTALIAEGSFSKAAQRLGISQPSLSQFLVRLETDAQTELVDRSAKPLKLTAAGALFLRTEQQVDLLRETAAKQMLDFQGGVRGHVTVGASDYRETFFLAEVLPVFHRLYPLIEVSLTEGRTKKLEQMALEGAVDFSLVITPLFHPGTLTTIELYQERILIALSEKHRLAKQHPASPSEEFPVIDFHDLDSEPFIKIKEGQQMDVLFRELCRMSRASPRVVLESESMIAAATLASVGLGAALTTETLVRRAGTAKPLRAFSVEPPVPPRIVAAAYRSERYLSKAARALIRVMTDVAASRFQNG